MARQIRTIDRAIDKDQNIHEVIMSSQGPNQLPAFNLAIAARNGAVSPNVAVAANVVVPANAAAVPDNVVDPHPNFEMPALAPVFPAYVGPLDNDPVLAENEMLQIIDASFDQIRGALSGMRNLLSR
jgi:hypothetical protein